MWALQARERLAAADTALLQRFDRGDDIDALTSRRATGVDAVLRDAWRHCIVGDAPLALFAVGGYGRGELYPQSDVDLLVIADDAAQALHAEALARFFALLWDAGLPVGWTVVTKDRRLSAQWEHTVAVTADGVEILTRLPGDDNDL